MMTGCTQKEMAYYLGVPLSNLAMAESGARKLPPDANKIYLEMLRCFEEARDRAIKSGMQKSNRASEERRLKRKKAEAEEKREILLSALSKAEQNYARSLEMEAVFKELEITISGKFRNRHLKWKELMILFHEVMKNKSGELMQNDLRIAIAGLTAEIKTMEKLILDKSNQKD